MSLWWPQGECEQAGLPAFAAQIARDWAALSPAGSPAAASHKDEQQLEDEVAVGLAKCLEWPVRFSTEVLSAAAATAQYLQVQISRHPRLTSYC